LTLDLPYLVGILAARSRFDFRSVEHMDGKGWGSLSACSAVSSSFC